MNTRRLIRHWLALVVACVVVGCGADASTSQTSRHAAAAERGPGAPPFPRAVTLARAALPDGRVIRLRAIRDDAGACLLIAGIDRRTRGCGRVPRGRRPAVTRPVLAEAIVLRKGGQLEVFAATSARVARVRLIVGGAPLAPEQSVLVRADDGAARRRAGITTGPFGLFIAELPRRSARIRAIAFDAHGDRIGSAARFDHLATMGERFILG